MVFSPRSDVTLEMVEQWAYAAERTRLVLDLEHQNGPKQDVEPDEGVDFHLTSGIDRVRPWWNLPQRQ